MLKIEYSGLCGLSIINYLDQATAYIVDDDLNKYATISYDNYAFEPIDIVKAYLEATEQYYKGTRYPQFKDKAITDFKNSDFYKETLKAQEEATNND